MHHVMAHKAVFAKYVARSTPRLSSFHFSAIVAWSEFFEFRFEIIEERLCVFAHHAPGTFLYLPPLGGPLTMSVVDECFKRMKPLEKSKGVARIENVESQDAVLLELQGFRLFPKAKEYVYVRQDIVHLKGQAYKAKRHDINHLLSECTPLYRPLRVEDVAACRSLYEEWASKRASHSDDVVYRAMLEDNKSVHTLLLQQHAALGLIGRVVEINGRIRAYTLGYALNCDTFVVLLEVADLTCTGLSAFIFSRFCADLEWQSFSYVNAMDDFGLPQVAWAKESYHPCQYLESYTVTA